MLYSSPELVALRVAVSALYTTFARYPLRAKVEGCPHCVDASDNRRIHSRPLRELTWDELARYSWKSLTTWGDADDFRHFLPRLFELIAYQADPATVAFYSYPYDEEVLFGKLTYAIWRDWPEGEQAALDDYLIALWRAALAIYPAPTPVSLWLSCIGVATNLDPFLTAWRANETASALRHLAGFIEHPLDVFSIPAQRHVWWRGTARGQQMLAWLRDPRTRVYLEDGFFRYVGEPFAADLSRAVQHLG